MSKIKKLKFVLELFEIYVDDDGVIMRGLDPGVRYNIVEDNMEVKNEHVETESA